MSFRGGGGAGGPVAGAWSNPYASSFAVPLARWFPNGVVEAPGGLFTAGMLGWYTLYGPYSPIGINTQPLAVVAEDQPLVAVGGSSANFGFAPVPSWCSDFVGGSGDSPLLIYQPSRGLSWEMWGSHDSSTGVWTTSDGAQVAGMAGSTGAISQQYHEAASGLSYIGTIITNQDVLRAQAMDASGAGGDLGHVLALQVTWEQEPFWPPAVSRDGGVASTPFAPPEGGWFYLPPDVAMPAGMCPLAQYVFRTLQRFGAVVTDVTQGNGVYFVMEDPADWAPQGYLGEAPLLVALDGQPDYAALSALPLGSCVQIVPPATGAPASPAPAAPVVTLTAAANALEVAWTSSADAAQFVVTYRTSAGPGPWQVWLGPNGQNPAASPVTIAGLVGATSYDVQVWAIGAALTASAIETAAPTGGAWGFVQAPATIQSWNQGNVLAFAANVTAGDVIVMASASYSATTTVTDTQGNAWAKVVASAAGPNGYFAELWSTKASASGALTVTRDGGGIWTVAEYAGPAGSVASGSAIGTGQAVSVPLGSAVTASPALVVMVGAEGTNKSWKNAAAAGPAWAQRSTNSAGSSGCLLEDMTTGALIAWAALAQLTASQEWQGVVAAFQ